MMIRVAREYQDFDPMDDRRNGPLDRFMLWVDAVGGFLVCLGDELILGQPGREGVAQVPIMADISSRHARLCRDGEGYLLEPIRRVSLDGRLLRGAASLRDGAEITLGQSVRLVFRRPHPLSATARLDFASPHRTQPPADGVLLMADSCVLGPNSYCHVVCRDWPQEVILFRRDRELSCRTPGAFQIDSARCQDRAPVRCGARIAGEGFSMCLEALNAPG
jgi:hypothetical protein